MAARRVLSFQTPRKRTATPTTAGEKAAASRATPARAPRTPRKVSSAPVESPFKDSENAANTPAEGREDACSDTGDDAVAAHASPTENALISAYRAENTLLRALKSDALLYKTLFGFQLTEEDGAVIFDFCREFIAPPGAPPPHVFVRRLRFSLSEDGDDYLYHIFEACHCPLPEHMQSDIVFQRSMFPHFIAKLFKVLYSL